MEFQLKIWISRTIYFPLTKIRKSQPNMAVDDNSSRTIKECLTYRFPKLTFTVAVPIGETLLPSAFISWIPLVGRTCSVGIYLWATTEQEAPESNSIKVV